MELGVADRGAWPDDASREPAACASARTSVLLRAPHSQPVGKNGVRTILLAFSVFKIANVN
jgi:hypothetical protein